MAEPYDDFVYPPKWAVSAPQPFVGSPLVESNNSTYPAGYTQSVKLPGLTTPSGNYYGAAGVTLHAVRGVAHTPPKKWPWW